MTADQLSDFDFEIVISLADDAEPFGVIFGSVAAAVTDSKPLDVLARCRALEARGIVRLLWMEGGRFRDPATPIKENEFGSVLVTARTQPADFVTGLWAELTAEGKRYLLERLGPPDPGSLYRLEHYPPEMHLVVYAANEALADEKARDYQARDGGPEIAAALRTVERGVSFVLRSGHQVSDGCRVSYRWPRSTSKH